MNRLYGIILLLVAVITILLSCAEGDDITGSIALLLLSIPLITGGRHDP